MFTCDGKPTMHTLTKFVSKATGKSYENAYMELRFPKLGVAPLKEIKFGFDYKDLVKEGPFNLLGKPSMHQVASFMEKEAGFSYESAMTELNMIRPKRFESRPFDRGSLFPGSRPLFLKPLF